MGMLACAGGRYGTWLGLSCSKPRTASPKLLIGSTTDSTSPSTVRMRPAARGLHICCAYMHAPGPMQSHRHPAGPHALTCAQSELIAATD